MSGTFMPMMRRAIKCGMIWNYLCAELEILIYDWLYISFITDQATLAASWVMPYCFHKDRRKMCIRER